KPDSSSPTSIGQTLSTSPAKKTFPEKPDSSSPTSIGQTPSTSSAKTTSPSHPVTTAALHKNLKCLFVGDMYNFNDNQTAYDQEKYFIGNISKSIFDLATLTAGLTLYGGDASGTAFPSGAMNEMKNSFQDFKNLLNKMKYNKDGNNVATEE
ncbi:hypothetical protein GCK32_020468, partial [Trichostrongylus colubriformis]